MLPSLAATELECFAEVPVRPAVEVAPLVAVEAVVVVPASVYWPAQREYYSHFVSVEELQVAAAESAVAAIGH